LWKNRETIWKPHKFSTSKNAINIKDFRKTTVFHICGKLSYQPCGLTVENRPVFHNKKPEKLLKAM